RRGHAARQPARPALPGPGRHRRPGARPQPPRLHQREPGVPRGRARRGAPRPRAPHRRTTPLMRYLWVGLGGAVGSMARYAIGGRADQSAFPWATLGINLTGAFLLGLLLTVAAGRVSTEVTTPVAVGVLG